MGHTKSFFKHFYNENEWSLRTLCAQLLLQFYSDSFETGRMSWPCLEVCMWFEYNPQINF